MKLLIIQSSPASRHFLMSLLNVKMYSAWMLSVEMACRHFVHIIITRNDIRTWVTIMLIEEGGVIYIL
jgi:hypothetical protein